jgi:large subunit ribosomal protein L21
MYAVIDTGGHQHRVQVGDIVRVERIAGESGSSVVFDRVLIVGGDDGVKIGRPTLDGATVKGTVLSQDRDGKILIYTYKKRKNSARKRAGHRQSFTAVKIDAIEV